MNDERIPITRRDFVRGSVAAVLVASVPARAWAQGSSRVSSVVLVRDETVLDAANKVNGPVLKQMLAQTVMRVTGATSEKEAWLALIKPEDVVGIITTRALNPTHREVVDAVHAGLVGAGIPSQNIRVPAMSGPAEAKACTAFINLPALKAHWLTGIGTVLKNYILFSGAPQRYHDENNVRLGEVWKMPDVQGKTRLNLVDALRPLCDKGPQVDPRYLWNYNGLLAGRDPVAVETVGLNIINSRRAELRGEPWPLSPPPLCVEAADKTYGLGTSNLAEIRIERVGYNKDSRV